MPPPRAHRWCLLERMPPPRAHRWCLLERMPPPRAHRWCLSRRRRRYGGAAMALKPLAWVTWTWLEPYSLGAYVGSAPPGLMTRVGGDWRAPCGALHWAGAEIAGAFAGCAVRVWLCVESACALHACVRVCVSAAISKEPSRAGLPRRGMWGTLSSGRCRDCDRRRRHSGAWKVATVNLCLHLLQERAAVAAAVVARGEHTRNSLVSDTVPNANHVHLPQTPSTPTAAPARAPRGSAPPSRHPSPRAEPR